MNVVVELGEVRAAGDAVCVLYVVVGFVFVE